MLQLYIFEEKMSNVIEVCKWYYLCLSLYDVLTVFLAYFQCKV
jgi:hypothetical protein